MYVNPGSIIAIGVIFPVLGTAAVLARFIARYKTRAGFKADDWLCLPALVLVIVTGAFLIWGSAVGVLGVHSPQYPSLDAALTDPDPKHATIDKFEYTIDILNPLGTGLIRLSFLFFYRRIFRGKAFQIVSWTMIGLVIAWIVTFTIAELSFCRDDLPAFWATTVLNTASHCTHSLQIYGAEGITCFILDLAILTMPFFWIWRLHMDAGKKLVVSSVFFVGFFTVAASAVKMVAMIDMWKYKWGVEEDVLGLKGVSDTMGTISVVLFWQYIEQGTGMVVCCLPSINPLLRDFREFSLIRSIQSWSFRSSKASKSAGSSRTEKESSHKPDVSSDEDERVADNITVTSEVDQFTVARADGTTAQPHEVV